MSDKELELIVSVREYRRFDEQAAHTLICHGEAPDRRGQTQRFHLAMTNNGERLYLFREGHLPQRLEINELVNAWLLAANEPPLHYTCEFCGRMSYHPQDIEHRYCGCCGSADPTWAKVCPHRGEVDVTRA